MQWLSAVQSHLSCLPLQSSPWALESAELVAPSASQSPRGPAAGVDGPLLLQAGPCASTAGAAADSPSPTSLLGPSCGAPDGGALSGGPVRGSVLSRGWPLGAPSEHRDARTATATAAAPLLQPQFPGLQAQQPALGDAATAIAGAVAAARVPHVVPGVGPGGLPQLSVPLTPPHAEALARHLTTLATLTGCAIAVRPAGGVAPAAAAAAAAGRLANPQIIELIASGTPPQLQSASIMLSRLLAAAAQ
jgi:hypothetical protein